MVDVGCFHGQVAGRVEGVTFILRGLVGRLAHCQEVCKSGSMVTTHRTKKHQRRAQRRGEMRPSN